MTKLKNLNWEKNQKSKSNKTQNLILWRKKNNKKLNCDKFQIATNSHIEIATKLKKISNDGKTQKLNLLQNSIQILEIVKKNILK